MIEKWEYCRLRVEELRFVEDKKKNKKGWRCSMNINYMGHTHIFEYLCDEETQIDENKRYYNLVYPEDPWAVALGILGSYGWELVSVQHGNTEYAHLKFEAIAYFKRPADEARQINEPKFLFPFTPERWY